MGVSDTEQSQFEIVDGKVNDLYEKLRGSKPSPQRLLFHYTNSQGLLGILTSQKLWASGADFLNDTSEPSYALNLLKSCVEETVGSLEPNSLAARCFDGVWGYVEEMHRKEEPQLYVFCFSEDGDLLSQWRGYGGQCAGYALGFSGSALCNVLARVRGQFIVKVVYEEQEQREEARDVLRQIIAIASDVESPSSLTDTDVNRIRDRLQSAVCAEVTRFRAKFKMKAFKEEQQWRVVQFMPSRCFVLSGSEVKFCASAELLKPYVEFGLDAGKLPIEQVTIGPTVDAGLSDQALRLLLAKQGYSNVCLRKSNVPYRQ